MHQCNALTVKDSVASFSLLNKGFGSALDCMVRPTELAMPVFNIYIITSAGLLTLPSVQLKVGSALIVVYWIFLHHRSVRVALARGWRRCTRCGPKIKDNWVLYRVQISVAMGSNILLNPWPPERDRTSESFIVRTWQTTLKSGINPFL